MVAIDMKAATAPPKKTAARRQQAATVATTTEVDRRTQGLMGLGQLGQGLCLMTGQYADAMTVGQHWPNIAPEIAKLAGEHKWLADGVDIVIAVGPFGALIAAALPFALQIAANHRLIDAEKVVGQGVVPPAVLDAQMKARVAQMQATAMRDQQAAMREAQEMQAEYDKMVAESAQVSAA